MIYSILLLVYITLLSTPHIHTTISVGIHQIQGVWFCNWNQKAELCWKTGKEGRGTIGFVRLRDIYGKKKFSEWLCRLQMWPSGSQSWSWIWREQSGCIPLVDHGQQTGLSVPRMPWFSGYLRAVEAEIIGKHFGVRGGTEILLIFRRGQQLTSIGLVKKICHQNILLVYAILN